MSDAELQRVLEATAFARERGCLVAPQSRPHELPCVLSILPEAAREDQ